MIPAMEERRRQFTLIVDGVMVGGCSMKSDDSAGIRELKEIFLYFELRPNTYTQSS